MKKILSLSCKTIILFVFLTVHAESLLAQWGVDKNKDYSESGCGLIIQEVMHEAKPPVQGSDQCQYYLDLIAYYKRVVDHPKLKNCPSLLAELRKGITDAEADYNKVCGQGKANPNNENNQAEDPQAAQNTEIAQRLELGQTIVSGGMASIDQKRMQRDQLHNGFSSAIDQASQLGGSGEIGEVKSSKELYPANKSGDNYIRHSNQILLALLEIVSRPHTDRLSPRRIAGRTDKHSGITTWWGFSSEYILKETGTPVSYDISSLNAHLPSTFGDARGGENQYDDLSNKLNIDELYNELTTFLQQMPSGSTEIKFADKTGKNIYITHIPMHQILQAGNLDKALHYLRDFSW